MTAITPDECRELAERLGICWHEQVENPQYMQRDLRQFVCICGDDECRGDNPDFSDARVVLREMRKREDWPVFCNKIGLYLGENAEFVESRYVLDETGLLAKAALSWLRKEVTK